MLGAAVSAAGGLAEDFTEPLFKTIGTIGAASSGWAAGLEEDGAVLLVDGAELEVLELAAARPASGFSDAESSLASSLVDGWASAADDCGRAVCEDATGAEGAAG